MRLKANAMHPDRALPSHAILLLLLVASLSIIAQPVAALPTSCSGTKVSGLVGSCSFECTRGGTTKVSASSLVGPIEVEASNCGTGPACSTPLVTGSCSAEAPADSGSSGVCLAYGYGTGSFSCSG